MGIAVVCLSTSNLGKTKKEVACWKQNSPTLTEGITDVHFFTHMKKSSRSKIPACLSLDGEKHSQVNAGVFLLAFETQNA